MNEKIKNFMEYVSADEKLKAELKSTLEGTNKKDQVSKIIAFAKKHGVELTKDDILTDCVELDEVELEAVSGGGGCGCAIGGFGDGDGLTCTCVLGGSGVVTEAKDRVVFSSQGGCMCPLAGLGATRRH